MKIHLRPWSMDWNDRFNHKRTQKEDNNMVVPMKEDQFEGEHEDKFDKLYDEESSSANWSSCTQLVGWFLILIQPWWAFPTIDLPKRSLWWFCFWMLRVDDIKWKFNRQIESLQSYDIKWKFNKQIKLVRSYDGSVMNVCCSSSSMFFQGIDHKPSKEHVSMLLLLGVLDYMLYPRPK